MYNDIDSVYSTQEGIPKHSISGTLELSWYSIRLFLLKASLHAAKYKEQGKLYKVEEGK